MDVAFFKFSVKHPCCCLAPRRLSLDEHVHAKEGGKETTGETALRLPSVLFPWSLAAHHQSLASTLRKTKRLRKRLSLISPATRTWTSIETSSPCLVNWYFLDLRMTDVLSNRSVLLTTVEVFSIIIFNFLSLTGNIMVCIAVYKNTRLRTTTNLYIIELAISDLMSGVFVMPFAMGVLIKGEWVYGRVICYFHNVIFRELL